MSTKDTIKLAYEQMQEDREKIKESYEQYARQMVTLQDYAMNGANINKCLELLTKQTAQLLELAKLESNLNKGADDHLTGKDAENLYNMIGKEVTQLKPKAKNGNKRS